MPAVRSFYRSLRQQTFFIPQRHFAASSFLLSDNLSSRPRAALLRPNGATVGKHCFLRDGSISRRGSDLCSEVRAGAQRPAPVHFGHFGEGAGAIVAIGAGAIVAAGALVTKDVPPDTPVAGVPAQPVRVRWP